MVVHKQSTLLTFVSLDDRSSLLEMIPEGEAFSAVDYDPVGRNFILARKRQQGGRIEIISMQGLQMSREVLFTCNVQSPESLAVDWRGGNVYWTDSKKGTIEIIRIQGKKRMVLYKDLDTPTAVTLQQELG